MLMRYQCEEKAISGSLGVVMILAVFLAGVLWALSVTANSGSSIAKSVRFTIGGQEAWVARYNGSGNDDDEATAMAVDAFGNVYVTGFSFDPNTDYDYITIKYNSAGQQQWLARYNGPENYTDQATAIAVDASGNVYVTGASSSNAGSLDYTTIRYNSAGQQQWVGRYDGTGDDDVAIAIAIDASGNVYVTGYSFGSGLNYDYATIKYNSAGQQQWAVRYDGPGNDDDKAAAIAVDGAGSVYVTGTSYGSGLNYDYATIKYDSSGGQQWVARYDGPAHSDDEAAAMAIDSAGNICVTGYSADSNTGSDYATIKYSPSGQQQWVARYGSQAGVNGGASAIALDGSDNVYVTGVMSNPGMYSDYGTIKYNASGQQQWVARYNGSADSDDEATAIAVDASGAVYVTGRTNITDPFGDGGDYGTIKYDSFGQEQWVALYAGPGNYTDRPTAISLDGLGSVLVTGFSYGSGTGFDYATIKYVQESTPTPTPTESPTVTPTTTPTGTPTTTVTPTSTPRITPTPRAHPSPRARPTAPPHVTPVPTPTSPRPTARPRPTSPPHITPVPTPSSPRPTPAPRP